jgi:hypothetical protein
LEKDLGNLRLLVSLWDEGGGTLWKPFYREAEGWPIGQGRWPDGQPKWPKAPPLFPKVVVVEVKERVVQDKREKEGGDGRPAIHFCRLANIWPQFSSTFHHPPHLAPFMLKPLTKNIKSKANYFHHFPKFFYFFLNFLDFITCNDEINKHVVENE